MALWVWVVGYAKWQDVLSMSFAELVAVGTLSPNTLQQILSAKTSDQLLPLLIGIAGVIVNVVINSIRRAHAAKTGATATS